MKITSLIALLVVILSFGGSTTSKKEKPPAQSYKGCFECDSISSELSRINDSLLLSNKNRSKKLVQKVKVLISSNKVFHSEIIKKDKDLILLKKDLARASDELEKKPKIIIDTVEKFIYIQSKKNFWGTTKIDTIR